MELEEFKVYQKAMEVAEKCWNDNKKSLRTI